jgi:hypothetical protein
MQWPIDGANMTRSDKAQAVFDALTTVLLFCDSCVIARPHVYVGKYQGANHHHSTQPFIRFDCVTCGTWVGYPAAFFPQYDQRAKS